MHTGTHEPDELHDQTRERFFCEEHEVVLIQNAISEWICPVCIVMEANNVDEDEPFMQHDYSEPLPHIEPHLKAILSHLDADTMTADQRIRIENACHKIYANFGGEDPDALYKGIGR